MPIDRASETLLLKVHPSLAVRVRALLTDCEAQQCPVRITQGLRDGMTQMALYAQGRQSLEEVNRLRRLACMPPITANSNVEVTNAKPGFSWHCYGLAADLCYATNDPYRENGHSLTWEQIGVLAEAHGLVWGGRFPTPDRPHVQWTGGLTLAQARAGQVPPIEGMKGGIKAP